MNEVRVFCYVIDRFIYEVKPVVVSEVEFNHEKSQVRDDCS